MATDTKIPVNIISTLESKVPTSNASTGDLYFTTDGHNIYRGNGTGTTYSFTKITVSGSGPAINTYDSNSKTFTRRNLNASDISTGLGYMPVNPDALAGYLPLKGGTLTGNLLTRTVTPTTNATYNLGTSALRYANGFVDSFNTSRISGISNQILLTPDGSTSNAIVLDKSTSSFRLYAQNTTYTLGTEDSPWKAVYADNYYGISEKASSLENINSEGQYMQLWYGTVDEYNSLSNYDPSVVYIISDEVDFINLLTNHITTVATSNQLGHVKSNSNVTVAADGTMTVNYVAPSVIGKSMPVILDGGTF